jgi:hypothetical protein
MLVRIKLGAHMHRFGITIALMIAISAHCDAAETAKPHDRGGPNSVAVFGGWATDTDFTQIIYAPWTVNFVDIQLIGAAYSRRLGTIAELFGDPGIGSLANDLTIETEVGASGRFGDAAWGELWVSLYLRYDGFPWNDRIYTTLALNTGWSILNETSDFERERSEGNTSLVLHDFSPELTFADPRNKDLELVLRLQHRSGIFGLVDGVEEGSTYISTGVRLRF